MLLTSLLCALASILLLALKPASAALSFERSLFFGREQFLLTRESQKIIGTSLELDGLSQLSSTLTALNSTASALRGEIASLGQTNFPAQTERAAENSHRFGAELARARTRTQGAARRAVRNDRIALETSRILDLARELGTAVGWLDVDARLAQVRLRRLGQNEAAAELRLSVQESLDNALLLQSEATRLSERASGRGAQN